jgi:hypothetical protein
MPEHSHQDPAITLEQLRSRVLGGGNLLINSLTKAEMEAAQHLILQGEAQIIGMACRPYLVARRDRFIIS